jgi:hypothetical protein
MDRSAPAKVVYFIFVTGNESNWAGDTQQPHGVLRKALGMKGNPWHPMCATMYMNPRMDRPGQDGPPLRSGVLEDK